MNKNNISYQLIGFIYHYDISCYDGHNIAYCKKGDFLYENNDSLVTEVEINKISGKGIILFIFEKI